MGLEPGFLVLTRESWLNLRRRAGTADRAGKTTISDGSNLEDYGRVITG